MHGVLRDVLSVWENAQANNHLNSSGSVFSNDLNKTQIKNKIKNEVEFFDKDYWECKTKALLNIMIMAHGDPSGCLAVSGGLMFYDDIVKCLADCINN